MIFKKLPTVQKADGTEVDVATVDQIPTDAGAVDTVNLVQPDVNKNVQIDASKINIDDTATVKETVAGAIADIRENGGKVDTVNDIEPDANKNVTITGANITTGTSTTTGTVANDISSLKSNKVDKVDGKGLSTNDYTTTDKNKVASALVTADIGVSVEAYDATTVKDASYQHTDNNYTTAEKNKLSTVAENADKTPAGTVVDGAYVHTDNNYTSTEKTKLSGIETGAQVNAPNTVVDANYSTVKSAAQSAIQDVYIIVAEVKESFKSGTNVDLTALHDMLADRITVLEDLKVLTSSGEINLLNLEEALITAQQAQELITAAIEGNIIGGGSYWYGRRLTATAWPTSGTRLIDEERGAFDFETVTPYSCASADNGDGTYNYTWTAGTPLIWDTDIHNGSRLFVSLQFLDLQDNTAGFAFASNVTASGGNWSYMPFGSHQPDNITIGLNNTTGAMEVKDASITVAKVSTRIQTAVASAENSVQKVTGKGLSTNDFTNDDLTKLEGIEAGAQVNAEGTVVDTAYVHTDNNYTDADKNKLSTIAEGADKTPAGIVIDAAYVHTDTNYTAAEASKLSGIQEGAQVNAPNTVVDADYSTVKAAAQSAVQPDALEAYVEKPESPTETGSYTKVTVNADGLVTAGSQLESADIPQLDTSKITGLGNLATKTTIVNADVDASAAIEQSKIQGLTTALANPVGQSVFDATSTLAMNGIAVQEAMDNFTPPLPTGTWHTYEEAIDFIVDAGNHPDCIFRYNGDTGITGIISAREDRTNYNFTQTGYAIFPTQTYVYGKISRYVVDTEVTFNCAVRVNFPTLTIDNTQFTDPYADFPSTISIGTAGFGAKGHGIMSHITIYNASQQTALYGAFTFGGGNNMSRLALYY